MGRKCDSGLLGHTSAASRMRMRMARQHGPRDWQCEKQCANE